MTSPHARSSQFVLGDRVVHIDAPTETMKVVAITYQDGLPYLTLESTAAGWKETVQGVLDTKDLRRADGRPTIYDRDGDGR